VDRVVQLRGVADDDPAVAKEFGNGFVAALGNEMRGVFLHLRALQQGRHRRVFLERFQQAIGRFGGSREVRNQAAMPTEMLSLLVYMKPMPVIPLEMVPAASITTPSSPCRLNLASIVSRGRKCISLTARATWSAFGVVREDLPGSRADR